MTQRTRIDKWLWAARFFKTRSQAQTAVENGKVRYENNRCKPAKDVQLNATIRIRKGEEVFEVVVTGLSQKRGNATLAATLYAETPESLAQREEARSTRQAKYASKPQFDYKPNKRERRHLTQLKQWDDND